MNDKAENMKKMQVFNNLSVKDEKQIAIKLSERYSEDLKKREAELIQELEKQKELFKNK